MKEVLIFLRSAAQNCKAWIFAILFASGFLLPVFLFAQMEWICATDSAGWPPRYLHSSVVFNNKIWVLGGDHEYGNFTRDVWYSTDGVNWILATDSAGWPWRAAHTSVVFDDRIWVIGGAIYNRLGNDVWYSTDGVNWTCATESAGWLSRGSHTSVVFDNRIWVIGGIACAYVKNDVWFSRGLGMEELRPLM